MRNYGQPWYCNYKFLNCPAQLNNRPARLVVIQIIFAFNKNEYFKKTISMKTKMKLLAALKIWIVIYPSSTLFFYLFGESLSVLPLYQRTLLLTIVLVPWIVFGGVPFVDSILGMISTKTDKSK